MNGEDRQCDARCRCGVSPEGLHRSVASTVRYCWRAWSAATSLLAAPLTTQKSVMPKTERTRINMHQDYEVQYRTKSLGVTKEQLAEAISKVGNSTQAVLRELANSETFVVLRWVLLP
jgi:uncharacterized protein DUF3606